MSSPFTIGERQARSKSDFKACVKKSENERTQDEDKVCLITGESIPRTQCFYIDKQPYNVSALTEWAYTCERAQLPCTVPHSRNILTSCELCRMFQMHNSAQSPTLDCLGPQYTILNRNLLSQHSDVVMDAFLLKVKRGVHDTDTLACFVNKILFEDTSACSTAVEMKKQTLHNLNVNTWYVLRQSSQIWAFITYIEEATASIVRSNYTAYKAYLNVIFFDATPGIPPHLGKQLKCQDEDVMLTVEA